jgi:hypothetical protein
MDDCIIGKIPIVEILRTKFQKDTLCWKTIKNCKKKGMPLYYAQDGRPYIKIAEVMVWYLNTEIA